MIVIILIASWYVLNDMPAAKLEEIQMFLTIPFQNT
jgi:hypothetical protein